MLRKAIHEGWIRVRRPSEDRKRHIVNLFSEIDEGEAAVIDVALEDEKPTVIIDDAEARVAAEYFGFDAHGTLYVILEAIRRDQGGPYSKVSVPTGYATTLGKRTTSN